MKTLVSEADFKFAYDNLVRDVKEIKKPVVVRVSPLLNTEVGLLTPEDTTKLISYIQVPFGEHPVLKDDKEYQLYKEKKQKRALYLMGLPNYIVDEYKTVLWNIQGHNRVVMEAHNNSLNRVKEIYGKVTTDQDEVRAYEDSVKNLFLNYLRDLYRNDEKMLTIVNDCQSGLYFLDCFAIDHSDNGGTIFDFLRNTVSESKSRISHGDLTQYHMKKAARRFYMDKCYKSERIIEKLAVS